MYQFLSDEWVTAAREVRSRFADQSPEIAISVGVNIAVTDAPFADDPILAHFDTSSGHMHVELGHLDHCDVEMLTDYDTARMLFVGTDPEALMQSFLAGNIRIQGDMMKLMALQATLLSDDDPVAAEVSAELAAITAETDDA